MKTMTTAELAFWCKDHIEMSEDVKEFAQQLVHNFYNQAITPTNWNPQMPVCYSVQNGKQLTEYKIVDGKIDWTTAHSTPRSRNMGYCATVEQIFSKAERLTKIGRDNDGNRIRRVPRYL